MRLSGTLLTGTLGTACAHIIDVSTVARNFAASAPIKDRGEKGPRTGVQSKWTTIPAGTPY